MRELARVLGLIAAAGTAACQWPCADCCLDDSDVSNNAVWRIDIEEGAATRLYAAPARRFAFTSLCQGDLDGDGAEELLVASFGDARLGVLSPAEAPLALGFLPDLVPVAYTPALDCLDVDGDGDLDVVAHGDDQNALLTNDGAGQLRAQPLGEDVPQMTVWADPDAPAVFALYDNRADGSLQLWSADGFGGVEQLQGFALQVSRVDALDLNSDGRKDLRVRTPAGVRVVLRDGPGFVLLDAVTPSDEPQVTFDAERGPVALRLDDDGNGVRVLDVDGDRSLGALRFAVALPPRPCRFCDRLTGFLAELDGDGLPDVLVQRRARDDSEGDVVVVTDAGQRLRRLPLRGHVALIPGEQAETSALLDVVGQPWCTGEGL